MAPPLFWLSTLLLASLADSRSIEGVKLGQRPAEVFAAPLVSRLCPDAALVCEPNESGQRCHCASAGSNIDAGPNASRADGGATRLELDFVGTGDAGELALLSADGPDLAWAQSLAHGAVGTALPIELACPDVSGYQVGDPDSAQVRVGIQGTQGWVELRRVDRLPAAWGQHVDVHPTELPPLAPAREVPDTDWYGLELAVPFAPFSLPSSSSASSTTGWAWDQGGGAILDGIGVRAVRRSNHLFLGYGLDYHSSWLAKPEVHATLLGANLEAGIVPFSPAWIARPELGAQFSVDYVRTHALGTSSATWRIEPLIGPKAGVLFSINEFVAARLSATFLLSRVPSSSLQPTVRPGGLFFELGVEFGIGTDVATQFTQAQLEDARARGFVERTRKRLASMRGFWRPAGVIQPAEPFTRVTLPKGTYRLRSGAELAWPPEKMNELLDYGDSFRVVDEDRSHVIFVEHPAMVTLHLGMTCRSTPRPIVIEQLDEDAWAKANPELVNEREP